MYALGHPLLALTEILNSILSIYMIIVIAAAAISWVNPDPLSPIVRFLNMATEPLLNKIRPYMPDLNGIDLTPLALIILIAFIQRGILPIIATFAYQLTQ